MEWTSQTPSSAPIRDSHRTDSPDQQLHDDASKSNEGKGKFVQRIKQACVSCGSRRVKCGGGLPCANCVKSKLNCTYKEPKKRGPPKGSTRNFTSKRSIGGEGKGSNKSRRRSSADVQSQPPASNLPPHLRTQSGRSHSDYTNSLSQSPMEGMDARESFIYGRPVHERAQQQQQSDFSSHDSAGHANLSSGSFNGMPVHLDSLPYAAPDFSRDREIRPSFPHTHQEAMGSISVAAPSSSRSIDQSSGYYSAGNGSRESSAAQISQNYRPSVPPPLAQHQSQQQSQHQSQHQSQPHFEAQYSLYRPTDDLEPNLGRTLSNFPASSSIDHSSELERMETSRAFGAGSTWQPPTRTMPGPLPVTSSSSSSNSPSTGSQETSNAQGPLYSHYRGGTSGLGFFDSAKKKRQLPPIDFEREFTPGGSLRAVPSLDPKRQLPPILGESNSETRSSIVNSPTAGIWKPSTLSNVGVASSSPLASSSQFSPPPPPPPPPEDRRAALESYDAPENICFANGSLHAIAQERRRESSKLIMGNKVKHFGENTPNLSETSRDPSSNSSQQGLTPGDQVDSPSVSQPAVGNVKGKEKAGEEEPRSAGIKVNARRRENSPDEEEAPLALLDMGGLLADDISPLIITASQPRVPSVVIDHLWKIFTYIIHPHWPVLYRPSLGVKDRNYQIDPERQPLLFNSIGAIAAATWEGSIDAPPEIRKASEFNSNSRPAGMSDREGDDLEDARIIMKLNGAQLSTVFFVRARYYLLRAMLEPTLEVIQSLIFMGLCENGIGRAVAADQFSSLACRMCLDLGLHRYSDVSKAMGNLLSHEEDQAHRRTFYCCYVLDKHSAAILGRPPVLRWVETDCPFPSTDEHDEFENWGEQAAAVLRPETAQALHFSPVRSISNSVATVKLSTIVERILAQYNTVKEKLDPELRAESWEVPALRHQQLLDQWERELPDSLRWEYQANQLPHVLLLHLWYHISRIILHRPFILKQPTLPQLPSSHQECTHATSRICQILDLYESKFSLRKLSSTFVFILFTASTIALANLTSNDVIIAQTAKRHLRQFMRWLALISETWPSAGHHLKILEQLGHDIDANLAGLDVVAEANFGELASLDRLAGPITHSSRNASLNLAQPLEGDVDEQEFVRVHDSSFWEAMPLSSQESVWNNFTSSYLEAVNQLRPMSDSPQVGNSIEGSSSTASSQVPIHLQNQAQSQAHLQSHHPPGNMAPTQIQGRQIRRRHTQSSTLDQALSGFPGFG